MTTAGVSSSPFQIEALGPSGPYRSLRREPVPDVSGALLCELSIVPAPYVSSAMARLRVAEAPGP